MFDGPLSESILGRAREAGHIEVHLHDLRDWAHDRHRTVDDYPFGGGAGMVMKPEPLFEAIEAITAQADAAPYRIFLTPQGRRLDRALVNELALRDRLLLICGRYEGIDQRFIDLPFTAAGKRLTATLPRNAAELSPGFWMVFAIDERVVPSVAPILRVMAPALMLQGFSALFTAILQVHGRFAGPAAVGVAFNAGILVGVILGAGSLGITAAAWGVSLGAVLQVALQLPQFIRESRAGGSFRLSLSHPRLGSVGVLAIPVAAGVLYPLLGHVTSPMLAAAAMTLSSLSVIANSLRLRT
jgi:hypothetical protein